MEAQIKKIQEIFNKDLEGTGLTPGSGRSP